MEEIEFDERFQTLNRDHRFRPIRQTQRKVRIDSRFQGIFFKKSFQENFTVDKRGRPIRESTSKNLRKFYHLSRSERKRIIRERRKARLQLQEQLEKPEAESVENTSNNNETNGTGCEPVHEKSTDLSTDIKIHDEDDGKSNSGSDSDSSYLSSDDEDSDIDLARGRGNVESSSDEDDFENEVNNNNIPDPGWGEMDNEAPRSENVSRRLALCNMDWTHVRATDIFILLDSFKPTGGSIESVTIYPSEYGLKRMAEEEKLGPSELKELKSDDINNESSRYEDEQYNVEKLRQYELNRLKYYYAVVVCDSLSTAEKIYEECDGLEFEASSSKLDLRFIPDDMEFKDHPPKDAATSLPDVMSYKPVSFITAALNQTKVNLTWDETSHTRTAVTKSKFTKEELENMDVRDFLASSSGSEDDELANDSAKNEVASGVQKSKVESRAEFYRKALLEQYEGEKEANDIDMEITWEPDLKPVMEQNILKIKPEKTRKRVKQKDVPKEDPTDEAELEMLMLNENTAGMTSDKSEDFKIDVSDERFSAVYNSSSFAIDRSDSRFRKSEGMEELVQERQRRIKFAPEMTEKKKPSHCKKSDKESISQLVKSIKMKSASLDKKVGRTKKEKS